MTLTDALHALAVAGCRLTAGPTGGMSLEVPPGAAIDRAVLEVLSANRDAVAAAIQPPASAADTTADLADYLASKGLGPESAGLVLHAANAFAVKASSVTIESTGEAEPVFFEPGIPCQTTADTRWHEPGRGYFALPAGTPGLVIPQPWAIHDAFDRNGIEGLLAECEKANTTPVVAVWIAGRPRVIEAALIDCQNVTAAPAGADLLPWRPQPAPENCQP
jgi:hypothetical protein